MVTIRQIAENVGVAPSTVSRALRGSPKVSPERTAEIRAVAQTLGYSQRPYTQKRAGKDQATLTMLVPDIENAYFASVVKAAQARARELGFGIVLSDYDEDPLLEARLVQQWATQSAGMLICSSRLTDEALAEITSPVVLLNREHPAHPSVISDDQDGVRQAVEHLYALGHRHIAYAGGPMTSWSGGKRRLHLGELVKDHPDLEVTELGNFAPNISGGMRAADVLLTTGAAAVLTHNDLMALGLIQRLGRRGVSVPGEVSVMGYDNSAISMLADPQLTTVNVPARRMGRSAIDILASLVEGNSPPQHSTSLAAELVIRSSCTTINKENPQ